MKLRYSTLVLLCIIILTATLFAEPTKIACVGNSITEGSGIADKVNDSWPAQLQKLLGDDYSVLNAGHSGRTMLKKGDFPLWVEPAFKNAIEMIPDIVLILLGTNDSKPWNWEFKDEFIPDYISMIDTFRVINPDVQIYACLPPPAFSVQWGIRDSIITIDQIPMIRHIADSAKTDTVDFYQPFLERNELFPDDIHPNAEGSWEMAKVAYKTMTGTELSELQDVDVAKGKPVSANSLDTCSSPDALVDGDWRTKWSCMSAGHAVVDLGVIESIDLFITDFGQEGRDMGQNYKIEVSVDSASWTLVVDKSTTADSSLRLTVDRIEPTNARYVKLTPMGPATALSEAVGAYDFRVLRTAPAHAPVIYIDDVEPKSKFTRFQYYLVPTVENGYQKVVSSSDVENPFTDMKGYRKSENYFGTATVRPDKVVRYFTKAYVDGVEVLSADTLSVDWSISAVEERKPTNAPVEFILHQNYPNPFNPSTMILYYLPSDADIELSIFNTVGKIVRTLTQSHQAVGSHSVVWNGKNDQAQNVSSGLYYYRLRVNGELMQTRKMLLLR